MNRLRIKRSGRPVAGRPGRWRRWALAGAATVLLLASGCTADGEPAGPPDDTPGAASTAPGAGTPVLGGPPADTGNPFGAHWDWSRFDRFAPYLGKLTGSATYHELTWCAVEPVPGRPDWSAVDRIARRSRELGITLHLKIRTGVCWATGGSPRHPRGQAGKTESAMPRDLAAYQRFVRQVVSRYAAYGVRQYAVENEVNAAQYWAGTPEDYERLVRAAAEAIHAADPAARVVDSGISSVAYGFGIVDRLLRAGRPAEAVAAYQAYFQRRVGTRGRQIPPVTDPDELRRTLTVETNARNVAFLAATERLIDSGVVQVRQVHFYEHPDGLPALLDYLRAETPAGVPVEAWEVGQFWRDGDTDPTGRAEEMVKVVSLLVAGGVRQVMWLPLAYNPNNRAGAEVRYGLLDPDGAQRPAGAMFAALVAAARDATVRPVAAKGLTGVAFERPGDTSLVVWSATGGTATVPAVPGLRAGPVGDPPQPVTGPVPVDAAPVLLRTDRTAAALLG